MKEGVPMEYSKEVECPSCRRLSKEYVVLAEWTMQSQVVNRVKCAFCKNVFRIYQGEKQDGTQYFYTINGK